MNQAEETMRHQREINALEQKLEAQNQEFERLKELARNIAKEGCSCDLLYGYRCGIHLLEAHI